MKTSTKSIRGLVESYTKGITPKYVKDSNILVLNQRCIYENKIDYSLARYHDPSKVFSDNKVVKIGDVLINSTGQGTAGRVAFVKHLPVGKTVITDSHILKLHISDFFTAGLVEFNLYSQQEKLQTYMDGSTGQGEFDKERLFNTIISFPEDKNSRRSAFELLDLIEEKVHMNNQIKDMLESITRLIYDYWFVQYDFPDVMDKPYRTFGGKLVQNEFLSYEIPENWDVDLVGNMTQFYPGISYTSDNISSKNGVPMINLGSIDKNREYRDEKIKFYAGTISDTKVAYPGEMLIACTDLTSEGLIIGCPIFVPKHYDKFTYSMDLSKLKITSEKLMPTYLYMALRTSWYHKYINKYASGTNVRHLDINGVKRYPLVVPPLSIQSKFNDVVDPIFQKINDTLIENQELIKIRDTLLPLLMAGKVRVGV